MVELIGLATLVALIWLLAFSMKTESDAEQRRLSTRSGAMGGPERVVISGAKHAA